MGKGSSVKQTEAQPQPLTNREVLNSAGAFLGLSQYRLPIAKSFEVAKLNHSLDSVRKVIDQTRKEIQERYAERDKDDRMKKDEAGNIVLTDREKADREFNELLDIPAELKFKPIRLPTTMPIVCEKCRHNQDGEFRIEPWILLNLLPFLEVE